MSERDWINVVQELNEEQTSFGEQDNYVSSMNRAKLNGNCVRVQVGLHVYIDSPNPINCIST